MAKIKDLFSAHSMSYAQYRPHYPAALFAYLASLTHAHDRAWDCACGNGQAAIMLAEHYVHVFATDISAQQIEHAEQHQKIKYYVASAYNSQLPNNSIDLVTVAQAFHWFDASLFAREVKRVAKANAVLAIWCYDLLTITDALDQAINFLYHDVLGPYWDPERKMVETNYEGVSLPFDALPCPDFVMSLDWSLEHLIGYIKTWSALQKYLAHNDSEHITECLQKVAAAFGDKKTRHIEWHIQPKIWRIAK